MFKKFMLFIGGLFALMTLTACGEPVPAGNVGVKFNMYGGSKGVQSEVVGPGRYILGIGEELYIYPTYTSTISYCDHDVQETETTTQISFQSKDNAIVFGCIGMNYHADEAMIPELFQHFRAAGANGDNSPLDTIAKTWVRQQLANAFNEYGGQSTAFELNGTREEILQKVFENVAPKAAKLGIVIEQISWLGPLHYPERVQASINNTLEAIQEAERARQELATAEAQAKITVTNAQASADATRIKAEAIAKDPRYLEQLWIERWNGELPTYMAGNATPMIGINK